MTITDCFAGRIGRQERSQCGTPFNSHYILNCMLRARHWSFLPPEELATWAQS